MDAIKAPPTPTATVVAPADMKLPELTRAIKDKVAQITSHLRTSVACAIETGALLIEAKKRVGHGNFERWVANNCELSPATARRWMELAEKRPELEKQLSAKTLNLSDLNLSSARRLIAPPKTPQEGLGQEENKSKPKPPATEQYRQIETNLIACLKDLRDKAESYANQTIAAMLQEGSLPYGGFDGYPNRSLTQNLVDQAKLFDRYTNNNEVPRKLKKSYSRSNPSAPAPRAVGNFQRYPNVANFGKRVTVGIGIGCMRSTSGKGEARAA
jgi:hypothetical protein